MIPLKLNSQLNEFDYIGKVTGSSFSPHNTGGWSAVFNSVAKTTSWDGTKILDWSDKKAFSAVSKFSQINLLAPGITSGGLNIPLNESKTIEFWFNSLAVSIGEEYIFSYDTSNALAVKISYYDAFGTWRLKVEVQNVGITFLSGALDVVEDIRPGKWVHVAIVKDASKNWSLFINGKLTGNVIGSTKVITASSLDKLLIGSGATSSLPLENFNGQLSNLLFFPTAKYTSPFDVKSLMNSMPSCLGAELALFRGPILKGELSVNEGAGPESELYACTFCENGSTPRMTCSSPFAQKTLGNSVSYVPGTTKGSINFSGNNSAVKLKQPLTSKSFGTGFDWTFGCWIYPEMNYDVSGVSDYNQNYTLFSISSPGGSPTADIIRGCHFYLKRDVIATSGMFTQHTFEVHVVLNGDSTPGSMKEHLIFSADKASLNYNQWSSIQIINNNNTIIVVVNGVVIGKQVLTSSAYGNWVNDEQTIGARKYNATYIDGFVGYISNPYYTAGSVVNGDLMTNLSTKTVGQQLHPGLESFEYFSKPIPVNDGGGAGVFCLSSVDLEVYDISRKSTVSQVGTVFSSTDNTASSLSAYPSYQFNQTGYITTKAVENNFSLNFNHDSFTIEAWVNVKALSSSDLNYKSNFGQGIFQLCSKENLNSYSASVTSVSGIFAANEIGMSLGVAGTDASNSLVLRTANASTLAVEEKTINYRRSGAYYSLPAGSPPTFTSALNTNTWHHIALTYTPKKYNDLATSLTSGFIDIYVDGVKQNNHEALPIAKDTILNADYLVIGGHMTSSQQFLGNIEELKITKNDVKYTGLTFVPSSANVSETPLVTIKNDNQIIDASTGAYLIVDNKAVNSFSMKVNGVDGVTFTDSFDPTNKANCKLLINTTNSVYCSSSEVYVGNSVVLSSNKNELFTFYYFNTGSLLLGFAPEDVSLSSLMSAPTAYPTFAPYNWIDWNFNDWYWYSFSLPTTAVQYDLTSQPNGSKQYTSGTTGADLSAWTSPVSFYKIATGNNGSAVKQVTCSIDCVACSGGTGNSQSTVQDLPVKYSLLKVQQNTGDVQFVSTTGFLFNVRKQLHLTALKKNRGYGWGWYCWGNSMLGEYDSDGTSDYVENLTGKFTCDGSWDLYVLVERPFIDSKFKFTNGTITETAVTRIGTTVFENFKKDPLVGMSGVPYNWINCSFGTINYGNTVTLVDSCSVCRNISLDSTYYYGWWSLWEDLGNVQWNIERSADIFDYWDYEYGWGWWGWWSFYWYSSYWSQWSNRACGGNANFSSFSHIKQIFVANQQLSGLNVTGVTSLNSLLCSKNNLTTLNVGTNTNLKVLRCGNNPDLVLTGIGSLNNLEVLHASKTKLNALPTIGATGALSKLKSLRLVDNDLTQTTVDTIISNLDQRGDRDGQLWLNGKNAVPSSSSILKVASLQSKNWDVRISNSGTPTSHYVLEGLSAIPQLKLAPDEGSVTAKVQAVLGGGATTHEIEIQNGENLKSFVVKDLNFDQGFTNNLNVSFSNITNIECVNSSLSSIYFLDSKPSLENLILGSNNLVDIDVKNCTNLKKLNIKNNFITSLDLNGTQKIQNIECSHNKLTELKLSAKPQLRDVHCAHNQINKLELINCASLNTLYCSNNFLDDVEISGCPKLKWINAQNCNMSTAIIDKLLSDLVASGVTEGALYINLNNETPSSVGLADISILQTREWYVAFNQVTGPLPADDFLSTTSTTGTLALGVPTTGSIEFARDRDWFKATGLTVGNMYTIYVDGLTLKNPELIIRNDVGKFLNSITNGVGSNPRTSFVADYTTYYFEVRGAGTLIGNYSIQLDSGVPSTPTPSILPPTIVPGDHFCTSTAISAVSGSMSSEYSVPGYYSKREPVVFFAAYRGEAIFAEWEEIITTYGDIIHDYDPAYKNNPKRIELLSPVYLDNKNGGYAKFVACVKIINTQQYIWVYGQGATITSYQPYAYISEQLETPLDSPESITDLGLMEWVYSEGPVSYGSDLVQFAEYKYQDDFTNTVSTTGTLVMGTQKSGSIQFPGDQDWLKVTLTPGTTYYAGAATLTNSDSWWRYGDLTLGLRGSTGQLLAYSDDRTVYNDYAGGSNSFITFTVPSAGDYYLDVSCVNGIIDYDVMIDTSPVTPDVIWSNLANGFQTKEQVYGNYSTTPSNYPLFGLRGENTSIAVSHKDKLKTIHVNRGQCWWPNSFWPTVPANGTVKFSSYSNLERVNMGCSFTKFEVTNCPKLSSITIDSSNLPSIDFTISSTQTTLKELSLHNCKLIDVSLLNLQTYTVLEELYCKRSKATSNPTLTLPNTIKRLNCSENQFNSYTPPTGLEAFDGSFNKFTSLNFTSCGSIKSINVRNNNLANLQVTNLANLADLNCRENSLVTLDLTGLTNITNIDCKKNSIAAFTLPGIANFLTTLNCAENQISSSLTLSNKPLLSYVNVSNNELTSLAFSSINTKLFTLDCSNNLLNSLTFTTAQSSLNELRCNNNSLTTIDTSKLTQLETLDCSNTQIATLDLTNSEFRQICASGCPNLTTVTINGSNIIASGWWWSFGRVFDFSKNLNLNDSSITNILQACVNSNGTYCILNLRGTKPLTTSQIALKNQLLGKRWTVYFD